MGIILVIPAQLIGACCRLLVSQALSYSIVSYIVSVAFLAEALVMPRVYWWG